MIDTDTDRPGWFRSAVPSGWAGDLALAAAVVVFAVVTLFFGLDEGASAGPVVGGIALVAAASIALRRRIPLVVLGLVVAARMLLILQVDHELDLTPAAAVALYTVARHGDRRTGLVVAGSVALAMGLTSAAVGDEPFLVEFVSELAQGLLPIAVGDAVRTRADRLRDLIDAEAEARVQAERLRIARDLHDVVAHGLSTIAVQSGVAAHLLDRDPGQAREALEIINTTGRSSLEELRAMVGVLRSPDGAELRPTPTDPDDLGPLLTTAGQAGVEVTAEAVGAFPADVADAAVVAVHRIVQEALTNVARHAGPVVATVRLTHHDDRVEVVVENDGPTGSHQPARIGSVASTGVGIVGMRERAQSLGGRLEAGPTPGGGFRVTAVVPYHRSRS